MKLSWLEFKNWIYSSQKSQYMKTRKFLGFVFYKRVIAGSIAKQYIFDFKFAEKRAFTCKKRNFFNSCIHSIKSPCVKLGRHVLKKKNIQSEPVFFEVQPLDSEQPLVSVIIPCFNYGAYVHEAIESVLSQTLSNFEILVIEGGSTDSTTKEICLKLNYPHTKVFFQAVPTFVGENRNFGIAKAKGRYICCLDADDILLPTYLEKALFILEHFHYDVVSAKCQTFGARNDSSHIIALPQLKDLLYDNFVLTTAVFRKSLWEKTEQGYVDVQKNASYIAEDWRFWIELATLGARFRNIIHEKLMLYRIHDTHISLSNAADMLPFVKQGEKLREIFVAKSTDDFIKLSETNAKKRFYSTYQRTNILSKKNSETEKKLLIATGVFINGGAERILLALVKYFTKNGWRVLLITTEDDYNENSLVISKLTQYTHEVYELQKFLSHRIEKEQFIHYLIKSRKVDIILQVGSKINYALLPQIKQDNPQIKVADLLFNISSEGHIKTNTQYQDFIDFNLADNKETYDFLQSRPETAQKSMLIDTGVEQEELIIRKDASQIRNELNIPEEAMVFGFSGRLSSEKNPIAFVKLAERFKNNPLIHFVMTGTGPLEADVILNAYNISNFHYCGLVENVMDYMNAYDVFVLPSLIDGRPFALMEALSLGKPCIASQIGGIPHIVIHEKTGILVEPNSLEKLESAVKKLYNSPQLKNAMAQNAKQYAKEYFDSIIMEQQCFNLFNSLVRHDT